MYKYLVKTTEKPKDKYSQPAGDDIPSQKRPKKEAGGKGEEGWETAPIPTFESLDLFLLPQFDLSTLKESACHRIRPAFLFNRRKKKKNKGETPNA